MQNRRTFIKTGLAGLAGASMIPGFSKSAGVKPAKQKIIRRNLGNTDITLPIVSMGAGDTNDPGLVKAAIDAGVRLLATSQYYGDGQNERIIGSIIKERGRDAAIIMTSAMPDNFNHQEGRFNDSAKAERFFKKFEVSHKRLGIETVDIFLLPFMAKRESVFYEPYLKAMENIKKSGKARFIGIATHSDEPEAIRSALETKVYDIAMVAYNFRKQNYAEISSAMAAASEAGMGIIAMKTMAGAFWDKERKQPINSQAALKWVLQNTNVHTAVPGITTYEQIQTDFSVMEDLTLTDKEKADLQLSVHPIPNGPYCQQCGKCLDQCRYRTDIPTLMRSHMYAFGYHNLAHASETLDYLTGPIPCNVCDSCSVNCAMHFNIRQKAMEIARLKDIPRAFLG
jgi:aryl-alcohol dehydrogenase-like predicted oxidoreductase